MTSLPLVAVSGLGVGVMMGMFGLGGAAVATPLLSLAGVPGLAAVASPLPAAVPGALLAGRRYYKAGDARPRAAAWTLLGAVPATVAGALLSQAVGGDALLIASGFLLVVVGARVILPIADQQRDEGARRRLNRPVLVAWSAGVGLCSGLLATGGGTLLVPLYLLVFGLRMRKAVGTSLLVVAVLSVPNMVTHWALGHIDWQVAAVFAAGALPAGLAGERVAGRLPAGGQRRALGYFLLAFGAVFSLYELVT